MKTFLILLLSISSTFALEVSFIGACSSEPLLVSQEPLDLNKSVGHYSIEVLEKYDIEHIGAPRGLNSAFGTPIGEEALEIISNSEMRAYGWCYTVGGFEPAVFPDQYFPSSDQDSIVWFFGYAHYKAGDWISQCEPAHLLKPDFLCK